ncbi:MAG TPA: hypothetical protein PLF71_00005 [bacterium]|nr:MAG: Peptidase family M28 [Parcubacteria group bacterium ADurb.Bin192]HPN14489.1 hypothetical protein [bacterium]
MKQTTAGKILKQLVDLAPRTGKREALCVAFLCHELDELRIHYRVEKFKNKIPRFTLARLTADQHAIPCKGACFKSGTITDKASIISSWVECDKPNINFNPWSDQISQANLYRQPAIAISRADLPFLLKAEKIKAQVKVTPENFTTANILIGNHNNPKNIIFAHFDSIETGATDNGSGVAVTMAAFLQQPEILKSNLFVLSGSEELSYDQEPAYWGKGYREFEKKHAKLLKSAQKIWVADSLGNGPTKITDQGDLVHLAFPLKNPKTIKSKVRIMHGDMDRLMTVYHSPKDDLEQIQDQFLNQAVSLLLKNIF